MTLEVFYQKLLNPPKPWVVSKVELSDDGSRVDVWLMHEEYTFLCSVCQEPAPTCQRAFNLAGKQARSLAG